MSFDPRKHAIDEHKRWIGYLQPDGVVVAPVALFDFGAVLDASLFAPAQERFVEAVDTDEDGAPVIRSFARFAQKFLGWRTDLLDIFSVEDEVPDALRISTGDYGELLRPDAAYRHLNIASLPDPARPWLLLVRQLPAGTKLDAIPEEVRATGWVASPAQKFERLLRATDIPIGILANGAEVRLLYAPRGENAGSLTFPVRFMTELPGRAVTTAFEMLLGHRRLIGVNEAQRLPALLRKSREYQGAVSTALAEQVLEALYELVRGFQAADAQVRGTLLRDVLARDPDEVYHALLTVLLRLVFLLFAEDRGLMPGSALYQRGYAIHGLFEKLRAAQERYPDTMDSRFGAWAQLVTVCRLVFEGCRHHDLRMPARLGHLFAPDRFPFLEGRAAARDDVRDPATQLPLVSDGTLFRVLEKLLLLDGERLSYRALDVEQIGSVYQTMIGFTLEVARGASIALKPAKSKGAPAFLDLDALLAVESGKRAEHLQKLTDHKLTGQAAAALKTAQTHADLLAALERKIARQASRDKVPPGSLILQPTDERRRSGSHYTPRALTAPIVRKTLEPVLARLGGHPTPQQILELKVCDPAVGSGAFLVEACRQLGDALVSAWQHHGGKPLIPPDEDELLHARRLVAQRCLYGVDRNPMATDLAKLSLWLATLARDHPFTFLDHSLRTGDALVGLGKKQIVAFHWDLTTDEAKQRQFGQQRVEKGIELATSFRREILEGGDFLLPDVKAERLKRADSALDEARRAGDLCLAAFFNGDKPRARAELRERYLDLLLEAAQGFQPGKITEIDGVLADLRHDEKRSVNPQAAVRSRQSPHAVTPFHWEIEFPEVFGRENDGFDAFVGNPPFMGGKNISGASGASYLDNLTTAYPDSGGQADLCSYFFRRAFALLRKGGAFGLIATNTISQGDTRQAGLLAIRRADGEIFGATKRLKWPGLAAVTVSVVHISRGASSVQPNLDGCEVPTISAFLAPGGMDEDPRRLAGNEDLSFTGGYPYGAGFTFDDRDPGASSFQVMQALVERNPSNAERIRPYIGGEDVLESPTQKPSRCVIDFGEMEEDQARHWPDLMAILEDKVKPERAKLANNPDGLRRKQFWWRWGRTTPGLDAVRIQKSRVLMHPFTSTFLAFVFVPADVVVASPHPVIVDETYGRFAVLQSRIHEGWARFFASSLEDRLRYTPSDCFETFPFPAGWETDARLEAAGREYYEFRAALMIEHNEGLTRTYNRFHDPEEDAPGLLRLRELHAAMDRAVLAAYGWSDLVEMPNDEGGSVSESSCVLRPASFSTQCQFVPDYFDEPEQEGGDPIPKSIRYRWPDATRDEVLARLLELNAERAAEERAAALAETPRRAPAKTPKKTGGKRSTGAAPAQRELLEPPQSDLFQDQR